MKSHTSEFKEEIKTLGKQQSVRITYKENNVTKTLTDEDINSATPNYEASLLKSVMKGLDLDSNVDIPLGTEIKFEYGLLINKEYEYLDISPKKTNKNTALNILGNYLNINRSEMMSVGDNLNDYDMIKNSGIGVAVANSYDDLKSVAKYVTKNNVENAGFAEAIYKFL